MDVSELLETLSRITVMGIETMNAYLVVWTYLANYGEIVLDAVSPESAAERVYDMFSDDFKLKGTCYVIPCDSVTKFHCRNGKVVGFTSDE